MADADEGAGMEPIAALVAALGGADGTALERNAARLPVERALEIGLFLARCEPQGAQHRHAPLRGVRTAARAIASGILTLLRPLAGQTMQLTDGLAELALALGDGAQAAAIVTERLAASEAMGAYHLLARAYVLLDDRPGGMQLAARLRASGGTKLAAELAVGELALAFEGPTSAEAIYRHALELSPGSTSALVGCARCLAVAGDAEGARAELGRVFAHYGDTPSAWVLREAREIATRLGDTDWDVELRDRQAELDAREGGRLHGAVVPLLEGGRGIHGISPSPRRGAFGALSVGMARASVAPALPDENADGDDEVGASGGYRASTGRPPAGAALDEADDEEPAAPELLDALRETFGYEGFLPGQATIVRAVLAGEDVLALMPTGAGKSLCYQLPALLLPGTTVLISPLIALMKDQLEGLPAELRAVTTVINSLVERDEIDRRLRDIATGRYKLVYAAPERLRQQSFVYALRQAGVARFVVDEAHCVSLWGHDFRPDYLFIAKALRRLEAGGTLASTEHGAQASTGRPYEGRGRVPVLALTATATPEVRDSIAAALGRDLRVVNRGVFRPNLRYEVVATANNEARLRELERIVTSTAGSGIVYVRSREGCEEVAEFLRRRCRVSAVHYHAGMERDEREAAQDAFISGRARVVAATVAFGMGIDKPDVRFIVHYQLPGSLEAYAQESGRAGRDGMPSRCVLFVSPADASALRRHVGQDELSIETLRAVYAAARSLVRAGAPAGSLMARVASGELERDIAVAFQESGRQVDDTAARVALSLLERAGFLVRHPDVPRAPVVRIGSVGASGGRPVSGGRPAPDPAEEQAFRQFTASTGLRPDQAQSLDLVALAVRMGTDPADLEGRLLGWRDAGLIEYHESGRDLLLEIPPPPPDGREALPALLTEVAERHGRQVAALLAYTHATGCRQRVIARHFGERLPVASCGTCDHCAPAAGDAGAPATDGRGARPAPKEPRIRDEAVVREAVVACLHELPYAVGVSGLVKILRGSPDVAPSGKRSPQYGALTGAGATLINRVLLAMIAEGVLERDASAEFPTVRLTGGAGLDTGR
ncbi:MAG TPA: DEAD/DEAH box helicase [Ktedonobacterales bacterium]